MKRPGLLRFIPFWPAILLVILALAWYQRLDIVTWIFDRVVIGGDIEDLTIAPQQLDLDRSLIASMRFKASIDNRNYLIDAENIEITYRFRGITSFTVEHVKLDRLKISPSDSQGTSIEKSAEAAPTGFK